MQMTSRSQTGLADRSDFLSGTDTLTGGHRLAAQMIVGGDDATAMPQQNTVTVCTVRGPFDDFTSGGRGHGCAARGRDIGAVVKYFGNGNTMEGLTRKRWKATVYRSA